MGDDTSTNWSTRASMCDPAAAAGAAAVEGELRNEQPRQTMKDPPAGAARPAVVPPGRGTSAEDRRGGASGDGGVSVEEADDFEEQQQHRQQQRRQPSGAVALCDSLGHTVRNLVATNQSLRRQVQGLNLQVEGLNLQLHGLKDTIDSRGGGSGGGGGLSGAATAAYAGRLRRQENDSLSSIEDRVRRKRRKLGGGGESRLTGSDATIERLERLVKSLQDTNERLRRDRKALLEREPPRTHDRLGLDEPGWKKKARSERQMPRSNYAAFSDERDSAQEESDDSSYQQGRKRSPRRESQWKEMVRSDDAALSASGTARYFLLTGLGNHVRQAPLRSHAWEAHGRRFSDDAPSSVAGRAGNATYTGFHGGTSGTNRLATAQEYLDEPITEAIEKVMRKGVNAFLAFQVGKPHRKYPPGERIYYVCQSCSSCRANPVRATYTSFSATEYPDHPTIHDGFAAYDVPLPGQARIDLQRHLRERRSIAGVSAADPPAAAAAGRRPKR
jgi:hypothetical protein